MYVHTHTLAHSPTSYSLPPSTLLDSNHLLSNYSFARSLSTAAGSSLVSFDEFLKYSSVLLQIFPVPGLVPAKRARENLETRLPD